MTVTYDVDPYWRSRPLRVTNENITTKIFEILSTKFQVRSRKLKVCHNEIRANVKYLVLRLNQNSIILHLGTANKKRTWKIYDYLLFWYENTVFTRWFAFSDWVWQRIAKLIWLRKWSKCFDPPTKSHRINIEQRNNPLSTNYADFDFETRKRNGKGFSSFLNVLFSFWCFEFEPIKQN